MNRGRSKLLNLCLIPIVISTIKKYVQFEYLIYMVDLLNFPVCRALVDEVNHSISLVDSKQKVQVGSFRVDSKGNQKTVEVRHPWYRIINMLKDVIFRVHVFLSLHVYITNFFRKFMHSYLYWKGKKSNKKSMKKWIKIIS